MVFKRASKLHISYVFREYEFASVCIIFHVYLVQFAWKYKSGILQRLQIARVLSRTWCSATNTCMTKFRDKRPEVGSRE